MSEAAMSRPVPVPVPSPCNRVCTIDARTGWCEGCRRTLAEIVAWPTLDDDAKRAVWNALAQRGLATQTRPAPRR